eukprot:TRINITY_DN13118_c0_g1_i2.p1 TRINITY_DN13118_c0_g1~~TRINITY_DN13118_c0_g1_i2.p1  ORF type:complete len:353 (+),score=38.41 TRINITY_DN13118_c0_g1_i2:79-1137(+)
MAEPQPESPPPSVPSDVCTRGNSQSPRALVTKSTSETISPRPHGHRRRRSSAAMSAAAAAAAAASAIAEAKTMRHAKVEPPAIIPRPMYVRAELVKLCWQAAKGIANRLPSNASEERLYRRRMPTTPIEFSLRQGGAIQDVANDAALRVVERWARILRAQVPVEQIPATIAQLVHGGVEGFEEVELPIGPLRGALRRVVPHLVDGILPGKWKFLDDITDLNKIERQFDRSSFVHTPPPGERMKLVLACGSHPPVWTKSAPASNFSRTAFDATGKMRVTVGICDSYHQAWVHKPKVPSYPGPGTYGSRDPPWLMSHPRMQSSPRRAEFPPAGKSRTKCLVTSLSVGERGLGSL